MTAPGIRASRVAAVFAAVMFVGGCDRKPATPATAPTPPANTTAPATPPTPPTPPADPAAQTTPGGAPPASTPAETPPVTTAPAPTPPAGAPAPSVGTAIDDTAITAKVKAAYIADPDVKSLQINVETRKGEVLLSGFVDSQTQIDRAVDIARRTQGVNLVQNKLALKTPGTVGTAVDDSIITTKVKTALIKDESVKATDISVQTNQGQVQLSGFVGSDAQMTRAAEVARGIEGVKGVDNKMTIKK